MFSPVRDGPEDPLHHGQVFPVIMGLEECDAKVQLKHDASDGPHVTRLRPTQLWKTNTTVLNILIMFNEEQDDNTSQRQPLSME